MVSVGQQIIPSLISVGYTWKHRHITDGTPDTVKDNI